MRCIVHNDYWEQKNGVVFHHKGLFFWSFIGSHQPPPPQPCRSTRQYKTSSGTATTTSIQKIIISEEKRRKEKEYRKKVYNYTFSLLFCHLLYFTIYLENKTNFCGHELSSRFPFVLACTHFKLLSLLSSLPFQTREREGRRQPWLDYISHGAMLFLSFSLFYDEDEEYS